MTSRSAWERADFDRRYEREDWTWYQPLLAHCVRYAAPGRILDLGAGLGFFVECCAQWGVPCIGLEGSDYAVERAEARGLDVRRLVFSETTLLPFDERSFSTAVMSQVITAIPPAVTQRLLREVHRVLSDQGTLIVTSVSRHFPGVLAEPGHVHFYGSSALRQELETARFRIIADLNEPRRIFGSSRPARVLVRSLYRAVGWDALTESASFVARKQQE